MNTLLTFERIQALTHGKWITKPANPEEILKGGAFDTRHPGDADIFFAWKGENGDGHDYVEQLADSEIRLIIVEKEVPNITNKAILLVTDSLNVLHLLARELIAGFTGKTVNITGSSGKTTAKEWLRHILHKHKNLLTNVGTFNNHIGCPITILNMSAHHDLLVLEMGTSGLGEIEQLVSIAPADIALLLNVGHAHLGKLGSRDNIYQAKLELFSHLNPGAISLLPFFDERLKNARVKGNKKLFGNGSPEFSWVRVDLNPLAKNQTLCFETPYGSKTVTIPRLEGFVGDLLSGIIAVCYFIGLTWEQVASGLVSLPQEKGRSTFLRGSDQVLILDDTYNANPESVISMLHTICSLGMARAVGVVGNLAELDDGMKQTAGYILDNIPGTLSDLFLSGETGKILYPQIKKRFPQLNVYFTETIGELIAQLKKLVSADTVIGVKGSRTSHLERVVYALKGQIPRCELTRCTKLMKCNGCEEL